ncbi:hypothetical protein KUTeg_013163 [Tegillarca granosa]|nr:hypothetical protein KUTeg_013163 [Tegillarca granosa]
MVPQSAYAKLLFLLTIELHKVMFSCNNDIFSEIFDVNIIHLILHKYKEVLIMWYAGRFHCKDKEHLFNHCIVILYVMIIPICKDC